MSPSNEGVSPSTISPQAFLSKAPSAQVHSRDDAEHHIAEINNIQSSTFQNETDRARAKEAAYALLTRLESPTEFMTRLIGYTPALLSSLGVCHALQLFQKWKNAGAQSPQTCSALAGMTGCNVDLLRRVCRNIGTHGVLDRVADDTYRMGPCAQALSEGPLMAFISQGLDVRYPAATNLPAFLRSIEFENPMEAITTNWEHLTGTKIYPWIAAEPDRGKNFDLTMKAYTTSLPQWVDIYPTANLLQSTKPDRPILVDIGGSRGHDLELLFARHPELPKGSLVLEDREEVIKQVTLPDIIQTRVHDFFHEQPIKGARAYYLHHVLHDWSEREAAEILKPVAKAMESGYSRLLVCDVVVQEDTPRVMECSSDLQMMLLATGRDRTVRDMKTLLAKAGLRLHKVWTNPTGPESVIEAVLEGDEPDQLRF